ncbi:YncE family protein, partial [Streptomyces sp. NPDC058572]|uniref:YncE family protein n=1 Tax=Streptomyces sp. NPDC058572 TaxID=3346546 RepID=UPI0036594CA6
MSRTTVDAGRREPDTVRRRGRETSRWARARTRLTAAGVLLAGLALPLTNATPAAADPGTYAYVTNGLSDNVSVINTATNTVTTTIPLLPTGGDQPNGVAVNPAGTRAYVTNGLSDNVSVIDTATNTVTTTIPLLPTGGDNPGDVAVSPDGTRAYTTNFASDNVSVIDTTLVPPAVIDTVPLGGPGVGDQPARVAVSPDGTRAYTTNFASDNVSVIDTTLVPPAV